MGEPNNALAVYMNRPDRIRSVLEYYLGEKLSGDWEVSEIRGQYTVRNSKGRLSLRQRDYMGRARLQGVCFLLGLENQETVNLIYPWRMMELDCLAYGREIEEIQERNQLAGGHYEADDDFKYRYKKTDRIPPILNLTLYWGKGEWKEPQCLRDMTEDMGSLPEKLRDLAGDYKVHLVSMRAIPEEELEKMDSDLKYVLGIMKRTESRKRYREYILEHRDFFSRIPESAADVIDACTHIKDIMGRLEFVLNEESGEEEADMCKALQDIKKDAQRQEKRRMNKLIRLLLAEGRQEDLLRSTTDQVFQRELFREYHI